MHLGITQNAGQTSAKLADHFNAKTGNAFKKSYFEAQ
jgi:hypothetical protein